MDPNQTGVTPKKKPRVLVVDDDVDIRQMLALALTTFFVCDVVAASSAREALRYIDSEPYQLVICDLVLGTDSGVVVFQRLRAEGFRSPFILFSANCASLSPFERDQMMAIEKPQLNELLDAVEAVGIPAA